MFTRRFGALIARWCVACGLSLGVGSVAAAVAANVVPVRIVIVSVDTALAANAELVRNVRQDLAEREARPIEFFVESLDTYRFPLAGRESEAIAFLKTKYTDVHPDLVIAHGADALSLIDRHRDELWKGVPSMGYAIHRSRVATFEGKYPIVVLEFDFSGTLDLAMRMHPNTKNVAVVAGSGALESRWFEDLKRLVAACPERLALIDLMGRSAADLTQNVSRLPPNTAVFYLTVTREPSGANPSDTAAARRIALASNAPAYSPFESHIGTGVVGGVSPNFVEHAHVAADLAVRVLGGSTDPEVAVSPRARCVVDARALTRWKLEESALPRGCEVRFGTTSLWDAYFWYVLLAVVAIALLGGLVLALLLQRRLSREAMHELFHQRNVAAHATRLATVGELVGSITHQINQPLAAMLINVEAGEALLDSDRADRTKRLQAVLQDVRHDVKRASEIVGHVRSLLQPRDVEHLPVDLNAVVQDTLRLVSIDATRRGVRLDVEVGAVPRIRGDRIQIEQVLLNLVLNAMDATMDTPRYLRRVCVTTRRVDARWIELVVSDNGHGLPPEHEEHIFRPFFTTKKGGMGLGLSMSRSIVQAHGGSLQARAAPGGGAIFTATFPVPEPVDEPQLAPELARILT